MIKEDAFIFMVLEFREIDFANMLSAKCKQQGTGKWKLDAENRVENAWFHFTGWYVNL
jgi:NifU-like protein involved in Fe-S cluster formation